MIAISAYWLLTGTFKFRFIQPPVQQFFFFFNWGFFLYHKVTFKFTGIPNSFWHRTLNYKEKWNRASLLRYLLVFVDKWPCFVLFPACWKYSKTEIKLIWSLHLLEPEIQMEFAHLSCKELNFHASISGFESSFFVKGCIWRQFVRSWKARKRRLISPLENMNLYF
jgi:hypothetical protein